MGGLAETLRRQAKRDQAGFSLIELLVVVAIIGLLMAMYSTALSKAFRLAKGVATAEAMHQNAIAGMADGHEYEGPKDPRASFRLVVDTGKSETIVSRLLYIVRTDEEFRAYWHTLLNPGNTATPVINNSGNLIAMTGEGKRFELPPIGTEVGDGKGPHVVGWEFISTHLEDTANGNIGGNVMYSDGHIQFVNYPGKFPMTPTVARLSHRFVMLTGE